MRLAALLVLAAGCAASRPHVRLALQLQGAAAGPADQQRCADAAARAGAVVDPQAPVQALVTLEPTGDRLQVLSNSRGLVREESRPAGSVETLCHDAALAAAATPEATMWQEPVPAPRAATPDRTPTTSGGGYGGPISP